MRNLWTSMAAVALVMGCGDDGGGSTPNVTNAAQLFNDPDGTITAENADSAVLQAIEATQANEAGQLGGFGFSAAAAEPKGVQECTQVDGNEVVTDFACIAGEIEDCTGSGNTRTEIIESGSNNFVANTQFNNVSLSCNGLPAFVCNGPSQTSFSGGTTVSCLNLTCTFQGESSTTDSCIAVSETGSNLVLVPLEDGSVVCVALVANDDCSRACSEWQDAEGDSIITCDITSTSGTCSTDGTTIQDVANCVVDRSQSTCDGF